MSSESQALRNGIALTIAYVHAYQSAKLAQKRDWMCQLWAADTSRTPHQMYLVNLGLNRPLVRSTCASRPTCLMSHIWLHTTLGTVCQGIMTVIERAYRFGYSFTAFAVENMQE